MKKCALLVFLLLFSQIHADEDDLYMCGSCAQLWSTGGPDWMITPNAGPCVMNGADLFLTAEFIYWVARQDHMAFANVQDPTGLNNCKGEFKFPDWKIWPGFKIGIGVFFDCDGWDLYANYTWLRPRDTENVIHPHGNFVIFDQFYTFGQDSNIDIQKEKARWSLNFNTLDLELGRNFFISQCLHLRPHFGLKGAWLKQEMDVVAEGFTTQNVHLTSESDNEVQYWGIGMRAGIDSSWHFTRCFSFIGEVAVAALWGRFESCTKVAECNLTEGTFFLPTFLETEFQSVKPVIELFLGLRVENWFCCDEYHYSFDAGWEIQYWGGQNQFYLASTETRWGDLGFQGLTLKFRIDF